MRILYKTDFDMLQTMKSYMILKFYQLYIKTLDINLAFLNERTLPLSSL